MNIKIQKLHLYICKTHQNKGEQRIDYEHFKRNQGCVYCAYEQGRQVHQIPEDICKEQVEGNGYIYVGLERINKQTSVRFICPKHKKREYNRHIGFLLKRNAQVVGIVMEQEDLPKTFKKW